MPFSATKNLLAGSTTKKLLSPGTSFEAQIFSALHSFVVCAVQFRKKLFSLSINKKVTMKITNQALGICYQVYRCC